MYNQNRRQLIFVELKTSDTTFDRKQCERYRTLQEAIRSKGGSFLVEDLKHLRDASEEHGKYHNVIANKVTKFEAAIAACRDTRIVYLVPKSAESKFLSYADRVLTFGELSDAIPSRFAEEWGVIRSRLCALDDSSKRTRNCNSGTASKTAATPNFAGRVDFHSILALCEEHGDAIIVGFSKGTAALANRGLASLEKRAFKWDHAIGGSGTKEQSNWIPGSIFYGIISQINARELGSPRLP